MTTDIDLNAKLIAWLTERLAETPGAIASLYVAEPDPDGGGWHILGLRKGEGHDEMMLFAYRQLQAAQKDLLAQPADQRCQRCLGKIMQCLEILNPSSPDTTH